MGKVTRTTEQFKKEMRTINPNIEILGEYTGSHVKTLCKCKVCEHEWETLPKTLLMGIGCPPCGIKKNAEHKSEKAHLKFIELTESDKCRSQMLGKWINYETRILFKCKDCGNEWETSPHSIATGHGCPECGIQRCTKMLTKTHEAFLEEMTVKNPETQILGRYTNDKTKIKCRCKLCGNLFEMVPNHLLRGHGCSVCTSSLGEKTIVRILNKYNIAYNAQQSIPKEEVNGLIVHVDFFTGSHIIEYNGRQHYEAISYFGGEARLVKQQYRDTVVKDYCKQAGYTFIEVPYTADTEEAITEYLTDVLKEGEMNETLISRDAKDKIRVIKLRGYWEEELHGFVIDRRTYQLGCKQIQQPFIIITEGKVKRSVRQQFELQYKSELKKYLDKGYKNIKDLGITKLTLESAERALPAENTDQNNVPKPMLCKVLDENNKKLTEKDWYGSYKCDGLRCLVFLRDGEVHTASRGGGNYDIPATYIRQDEYIIKILTENPDMILDGELYCHGKNLQTLSGWARKEELIDEHKFLRYHCYDIVNESMPFKDRVVKLNEFKANTPDDSKLTVLEQRLIHGLEEIEAMHNEAVAAGYEGLVIKDPEKEYKCGARDTRCLKVKKFQDAEAKILGIVEGLREEDMCFLMEMDNGIQFKAKPIGDRALKKWYREHIDEIVGQLGTYKYFYLSEDGVPILPTFRAIRNKKDI